MSYNKLPIMTGHPYIPRKNPDGREVYPSPAHKGRVRYQAYHSNGRDTEQGETNISGFRRAFRPAVRSIEDVKKLNRRGGFHFFDPDAMRGFNARLTDHVYDGPGGVYFVHSTRYTSVFGGDNHKRTYRVGQLDPDTGAMVYHDSDKTAFTTLGRAVTAAKTAAETGEIPEGNTTAIGEPE